MIAYFDQTNGDLKLVRCGDAACSAENVLTAVDSTGNVGTYPSIGIGTDGIPVISYYDSTNWDLKVARAAAG